MPRPAFIIRCSRRIFSEEEIETLERYGAQFEGFLNGRWTPKTENQRRFVEAARGEPSPETLFERVWAKYLWRVNWERDPANRSAMGALRRAPDDRQNWKRMRGAVRGGMVRRARGQDD